MITSILPGTIVPGPGDAELPSTRAAPPPASPSTRRSSTRGTFPRENGALSFDTVLPGGRAETLPSPSARSSRSGSTARPAL